MSDPVFESNNPFTYFTCDRDPTASEPVVSGIGVPSNWLVQWWNTTSGDKFFWVDRTEDALTWRKIADSENILDMLPISNWNLNSERDYSEISTPSFNTEYSPSETNDTFITVIVELTSTLLAAANVDIQVNSGNGFITRAQEELSGISASVRRTLSLVCPAGATYKIIENGSASLVSINQLSF